MPGQGLAAAQEAVEAQVDHGRLVGHELSEVDLEHPLPTSSAPGVVEVAVRVGVGRLTPRAELHRHSSSLESDLDLLGEVAKTGAVRGIAEQLAALAQRRPGGPIGGGEPPLIGIASDRLSLGWGRRKPWMVLGTPLFAVALWQIFVPGETAPRARPPAGRGGRL